MNRKESSLKQLVLDESGQIMFLFLFLVLLVLAMVMLNLNTGTVIQDKLRAQNAADMSALSGGAWMARCLNHVSMNNVAMTHTLAWILILRGIKDTILKTERPAQIMKETCCKAMYVGGWLGLISGFCCGAAKIAYGEIQLFKPVVNSEIYTNLISESSSISLWKVMKAFEYMNKVIIIAYPAIAEADAYWVARKNKADFGLLLPYPGFKLPLKIGTFNDLCDPTYRGSPSEHSRGYTPLIGYDLNEGPLKRKMGKIDDIFWPMIIVGGPFTFRAFTKASFGALCKDCGESDSYESEEVVTDYDKAKGKSVKASCWIYARATYGPTGKAELGSECELPNPDYAVALPSEGKKLEPPATFDCKEYTCSNYPNYPYNDPLYKSASAATKIIDGLAISSDLSSLKKEGNTWNRCDRKKLEKERYEYDIEQYRFVYARVKTKAKADDPTKDFKDKNEELAKPTLLDTTDVEVLKTSFSYLAVVYKRKTELPFSKVFNNPNPVATLAYGQVLVHNPTSIDLFTQDWHVKLVPTDKFNEFTKYVTDATKKLPEQVQASELLNGYLTKIKQFLDSGLEQVNHH